MVGLELDDEGAGDRLGCKSGSLALEVWTVARRHWDDGELSWNLR